MKILRDNRYRLSDSEIKLIEQLRNTGTLPPEYLVSSDANTVKLLNDLRTLKQKYKLAMDEINNATKRIDLLLDLKKYGPNARELSIPRVSTAKSESVAIAVASDWHVEERVDPSTVNNLNAYDPKEARQRAKRFFEKVAFMTDLSRAGTQIDTLVLALLGDLITGFIHEELMESNYMAPLEAVRLAQELIIGGIKYLLKEGKFKKILVPCSYGNHGRTTKDKRYGTAASNSYEQHMYYTMQQLFEGDPRVEFCINNSYLTYVTIFDKYVLRFHHGDAVKYSEGIGGITIPMNKAISQWNKSRTAYLDVFGHFHTMLDGGKFISNGSLIGYGPYSVGIKAGFEEPKQAFFLIERDRGKTAVHPIFVTSHS